MEIIDKTTFMKKVYLKHDFSLIYPNIIIDILLII